MPAHLTPERIWFDGAFGDRLAARLDRPKQDPQAYALFAHCFTCSKDLKAVHRISRELVGRGIGVFRFDFTGLGESEGDFADTNFSSNIEDLVAAADHMRKSYQAPRVLIGHSLGGAAVLAAAPRVPECVAVATIGAPSEPDHVRKTLTRSNPEIEARGESEVRIGGRSFRIREQFLEDLAKYTLEESIGRLDRALLVLHSPIDKVVGIEHARRIFEAAKHPKSFVALDGADHLLLENERDARFAADMIATWAGRYLG